MVTFSDTIIKMEFENEFENEFESGNENGNENENENGNEFENEMILKKITIPMKQHDGLRPEHKQFEDLVWYGITFQYNKRIDLICQLSTEELNSASERVLNLIKRLTKLGKSPILENGGGRNRILNTRFNPILFNLVTELQSIIQFRRETYFTF